MCPPWCWSADRCWRGFIGLPSGALQWLWPGHESCRRKNLNHEWQRDSKENKIQGSPRTARRLHQGHEGVRNRTEEGYDDDAGSYDHLVAATRGGALSGCG